MTSPRPRVQPGRWFRAVVGGLHRWALATLLALLAWQGFLAARVGAMVWFDPASTAFMRSELWRRQHASPAPPRPWMQQWVAWERISPHLKRAVVASEDDRFVQHGGVDWAALEAAWQRNRARAARAERHGRDAAPTPERLVGGSTITQQLAKNLFLSGERNLWRKGQELVITFWLEAFLSKQRILEIYLNSVEWGDGVFGAEAAAQRHFGVSAQQLTPEQAARLAVMLPAPKTFERRLHSAYLNRRTASILARMGAARIP